MSFSEVFSTLAKDKHNISTILNDTVDKWHISSDLEWIYMYVCMYDKNALLRKRRLQMQTIKGRRIALKLLTLLYTSLPGFNKHVSFLW